MSVATTLIKMTAFGFILFWGLFNFGNAGLGSWISDAFHSSLSVFTEVCAYPSINYVHEELEETIHRKVFGQPFLDKLMLPLVKLHLSDGLGSKKALALSFHGTPGSGKTYVAKIIAESIYKKGLKSKFVHLFKPMLHFSHGSPAELKARIQSWILSNVTQCERQIFIFDEVNDLPEGVLEAVKGFIDYSPHFEGLDFSKTVFIFLSNVAMVPINQRLLELWKNGVKQREQLEHNEFLNLIVEHAFNEEGGMKKCKLLSSRLIDAFVPFLPLEKNHVESCIRVIASEYTNIPIKDSTIQSIIADIHFVPDDLQLYSSDGCKNLETPIKLALLRGNYKLKDEL